MLFKTSKSQHPIKNLITFFERDLSGAVV